jgi:hypothetical protein
LERLCKRSSEKVKNETIVTDEDDDDEDENQGNPALPIINARKRRFSLAP